MCRACTGEHKGRRCPSSYSTHSRLKNNGYRRRGRLIRRTIAHHLRAEGFPDTAAMIMATPPSGMGAIINALDLDPTVIGDMMCPHNNSGVPSVSHVLAAYEVESAGETTTLADLEQAVADASEQVAATKKALATARRRVTIGVKKHQPIAEAYSAGLVSAETLADADNQLTALKAAVDAAELAAANAKDQLAAAEATHAEYLRTYGNKALADQYNAVADWADADRDAWLAELSDEQIAAIAAYRRMKAAPHIDEAMTVGGPLGVADRQRDSSVYSPGTIAMNDGTEVVELEGRVLDADTAFVRRAYGEFLVLYKNGDSYAVVGAASSKDQAVTMAQKIPVLRELAPLDAGASEYEQQAWKTKHQIRFDTAVACVEAAPGVDTAELAAKKLAVSDDDARSTLADMTITGPIEADVESARKRHARRTRLAAADKAGEAARAQALAAGATTAAADVAYGKARAQALGTPTVGGGVIPHFDHKIPPESLGADGYASVARSGVRAWGVETADDYSVVKDRLGNTAAWGFGAGSEITTSSIAALSRKSAPFLKSLTVKERDALRTYTGGVYRQVNAAITGRDPNPSRSVKTIVSRIEAAFDKLKQQKKNTDPMTLVRGTRVPSGWKGTTEQYMKECFAPGSRMEIGKVTSCTTRLTTAESFANNNQGFVMAIRSRSGLAVKSISKFTSEDEVILPMGTQLRCVQVTNNGVGGMPTVYLVEEDIVAEAQDQAAHNAA